MKEDAVITRPRFVELDVMRGLFVASLVVIHLRLDSLVMTLTGASKLWLSVAEGFFGISGFLLGFLNRDLWFTNRDLAIRRITSRALKLYFWSIVTTLLFTFIGNLMPTDFVKSGLWIIDRANFWELVKKTLVFSYVYGWADYLGYYAIYIFLTPIVLFLVSKFGFGFTFLLSFLIYAFRGDNLYLGMQLVFFGCLLVGFGFERFRRQWDQLHESRIVLWKKLVLLLFILSLVISIFSVHFFEKMVYLLDFSDYWTNFLVHKNRVLNWYFDKQSLGFGRIILFPLWFWGIYILVRSKLDGLKKLFGGFFVEFGSNSFKVYLIHAFVIFPVPWLLHILSVRGYWSNTIVTGLVLAIVFYLNRLFRNFKL